MVLGGTVAATFVGHEARYVWLALRNMTSILVVQRVGRGILNRAVGRVIRWCYLVQAKGVLALENEVTKVAGDAFLHCGVELVVTGYGADTVLGVQIKVEARASNLNAVPGQN